ncbi:MAG: Verru_Chthon cassette protein A [Chthoniobacterales bacterium]|nr:Verru_Chthon cassette protein A [Chthoniobacterales bacterium]
MSPKKTLPTWLGFAHPRRGAALVVVLAMLVLVLGLVVAFLARTTTERSASSAYLSSASTRQLAETTLHLVQSQIRDATTQGHNVAWTSQPGLIRTFGTPGSPGSAQQKVHKLYSADELISTSFTRGADMPPGTWATDVAVWTDLNAPVMVRNPDNPALDRIPQFPILDPRALNAVEGFAITSPPAGSTLTGADKDLRLPMPVKWLYVLQDGNIVAPTGSGTLATVTNATNTNPIVGRIAFWTDDDTSKVNINTASEGTFWDTPRTVASEEWAFADFQPAQKEFQRYPGHPAMTSLAPILFADSSTLTGPLTASEREAIYSIVPKVVGGGSNGGTARASAALTPDADRLYANVDELLFSAARSTQPADAGLTASKLEAARFFLTASSRAPEVTLFNTPRVAVWPIIHNHLTTNANRATAYDRLIAFCATIGGEPYYFQRENAKSPTADWTNIARNQVLLRYLRALSDLPIPGYGATLRSKTSVEDRDQLLVEMMDYVRSTNLYDDNLTPNSYASQAAADNAVQFTSGRRNDTLNVWKGHGIVAPLKVPQGLTGSSYPAAPDTTSLLGFGRFASISEAGLLFICSADGSAGTHGTPIGVPNGTDPVVDAKRASNSHPGDGTYPLNKTLVAPLTATERRIQAMLLFDLFSPMQGWTQFAMDLSMEVEFLGDLQVNGISLGMPSPTTVDFTNVGAWGYHAWGGNIGNRSGLTDRRVSIARGPLPADGSSLAPYNLVSVPITITVPAGPNPVMQFSGGTIRVKMLSGSAVVQTIDLEFPAAAFPVPALQTDGTVAGGDAPATNMQHWWTFQRDGAVAGNRGRLEYMGKYPRTAAGTLIRPEDTFRTVIPYHGDFRLVAASSHVPAGVFLPTVGYFDTTRTTGSTALPQIHNQMTGSALTEVEGGSGYYQPPAADRLVANAGYNFQRFPKFPKFAPAIGQNESARAFQPRGDFDNGVAVVVDGAYVNKPDEGNNYRGTGASTPYFITSYNQAAGGPTFFSPNRQTPGPGMFGSLPTRLKSGNQAFTAANAANTWCTLLLRPQTGHSGATPLPDHLWMDLFWMPVVEPYAISEPFSTAGKINLNYAIEPFTYIKRATGIVSLLRAEEMLAIPLSRAADYKFNQVSGEQAPVNADFRLPINAHETLKQLDTKFSGGGVFRSASEIADLHLVPQGTTLNSDGTNADTVMNTFWTTNALTGDNSRERPYANLLGRLTTKSNTFTVHYRVQSLKQVPRTNAADYANWNEGRDVILGEMRGAVTMERFIQPGATGTPDYATDYSTNPNATPQDLGTFYKWRIVNSREFNP